MLRSLSLVLSKQKETPVKKLSNIDKILEYLGEINPNATYPTEFKDAIIGIAEQNNGDTQVLLDRNKCLKILIKNGMTKEEAKEWFEYNVENLGITGGSPIYATLNKDLENYLGLDKPS